MLVAAGNGGELAALGQAERKTQQQEHTDSQSTAKAESSDSQASTIVPSDNAASDTEASGSNRKSGSGSQGRCEGCNYEREHRNSQALGVGESGRTPAHTGAEGCRHWTAALAAAPAPGEMAPTNAAEGEDAGPTGGG